MALILKDTYPSQTDDTDPDYPHGKARNATAVGDGTGFPLERRWVNDLYGFLQALLDEGSVTPSGSPDTATVSQYLEALDELYYRKTATDGQISAAVSTRVTASSAFYTVETAASGSHQNLTLISASSGFSINGGNRVEAPAGTYSVTWSAPMVTSSTGSNPTVESILTVGASIHTTSTRQRSGSSAATEAYTGETTRVVIATPGTDLIGVAVGASAGTPTLPRAGFLMITRVSP